MFALLVVLSACSPNSADGAQARASAAATVTRHVISGLPVIPLTVDHAGKAHAFKVELARTSEEQAMGLMFRTEMGADEGMIFPMDPPRRAAFWMKNTVIPLDIIYVGTDHRILNIAANAQPYSEEAIYSAGKVSGVLELNGGRAAQLGIEPGDIVKW
jgi:uncharacterized membrane protein (UPF0127 family)